MAQALHAHALEKLGTGPVYESLGVQGATLLPIPAEPGACYVLGLALMTINPEARQLMFGEKLGIQMMIGAAVLQTIGALIIRKIINVPY